MRISALDETLDDLLLHRAPQPARFAKLLAMPHRALPQRACARVARQVEGHRAPAPYRHPNLSALPSLRSALPFGRKRTSRAAIAQQAQWPFIEQASVNSRTSSDVNDWFLCSAAADRRLKHVSS